MYIKICALYYQTILFRWKKQEKEESLSFIHEIGKRYPTQLCDHNAKPAYWRSWYKHLRVSEYGAHPWIIARVRRVPYYSNKLTLLAPGFIAGWRARRVGPLPLLLIAVLLTWATVAVGTTSLRFWWTHTYDLWGLSDLLKRLKDWHWLNLPYNCKDTLVAIHFQFLYTCLWINIQILLET